MIEILITRLNLAQFIVAKLSLLGLNPFLFQIRHGVTLIPHAMPRHGLDYVMMEKSSPLLTSTQRMFGRIGP